MNDVKKTMRNDIFKYRLKPMTYTLDIREELKSVMKLRNLVKKKNLQEDRFIKVDGIECI